MDLQGRDRKFGEKSEEDGSSRGGFDPDVAYVSPVYFGMGRHFDLNPAEALMLATIHALSKDGSSWSYISQQSMANALNVTLPTINTNLESLREQELLRKGGIHPQWKTIQWKLAPKALDHLRYLQARIKKIKDAKPKRV
jgi:hypothetical protein